MKIKKLLTVALAGVLVCAMGTACDKKDKNSDGDYVSSKMLEGANTTAQGVYNSAKNYCAQMLSNDADVPAGVYAWIDGDSTAPAGGDAVVEAIEDSLGSEYKNADWAVMIEDGDKTASAVYASNETTLCVGSYPTGAEEVSEKSMGDMTTSELTALLNERS
ncbi:MAG: hypothetical protein QM689_08175 [Oscillospiraceae bacterium]